MGARPSCCRADTDSVPPPPPPPQTVLEASAGALYFAQSAGATRTVMTTPFDRHTKTNK
jgi:hypothetical protein